MHLALLGGAYADFLVEADLLQGVGALFGPAYKGIVIATATSMALATKYGVHVPISYNRKTPKSHGEGGNFIGVDLSKVTKAVVIDDVFTDGGTKLEAIKMLSVFPQLKVSSVVVGVDREEVDGGGQLQVDLFEKATGVPVHALTTKTEVLRYRPAPVA